MKKMITVNTRCSVDKVVGMLIRAKENGVTHLEPKTYINGGYIKFFIEREETDEEYETRLKTLEERKRNKVIFEKQQLKDLQAKYGTNNG